MKILEEFEFKNVNVVCTRKSELYNLKKNHFFGKGEISFVREEKYAYSKYPTKIWSLNVGKLDSYEYDLLIKKVNEISNNWSKKTAKYNEIYIDYNSDFANLPLRFHIDLMSYDSKQLETYVPIYATHFENVGLYKDSKNAAKKVTEVIGYVKTKYIEDLRWSVDVNDWYSHGTAIDKPIMYFERHAEKCYNWQFQPEKYQSEFDVEYNVCEIFDLQGKIVFVNLMTDEQKVKFENR